MLSAIPYHSFPILVKIGGFQLRTFGLMVGLGVLLGSWVAGAYCEHFGVDREDTYRLATRLVVAGVIGARISWDLSHLDLINSPIDLIAVWKGGLQFSGGFIAAVIIAVPTFRNWDRLTRWRVVDGYGLGLTIGLAFGRIGCTSVGEHFGSTWGKSWFPLMVRYTRTPGPAELREMTLGSMPIEKGTVFHNTAIYELIWLLVLFAVMWKVLHRIPRVTPGVGIAMFCAIYAPLRFGSDFLRINDHLVGGLTGAQYTMLLVMVAAVWLVFLVVPKNRALQAAELEAAANAPADDDADTVAEAVEGSVPAPDDTAADTGSAAPDAPDAAQADADSEPNNHQSK